MAEGVIRTVNARGYAFVRTATGQDYFLHASNLGGIEFSALEVGDTVTFERAEDPHGKGPIAINAERITRAPGHTDDARLPNEPVSGQWPTAAGRGLDEDTTYDWGEAG